MSSPFPYRLYLVTDEQACLGRDLIGVTKEAVKGGVDVVQLREKKLSDGAFLEKAFRMKEMLAAYNVPLIINDNIYVAQACQAAGIHVGNSDLSPSIVASRWPGNMIGYSIEWEEQLYTIDAAIADYLGISPVFATPTKTDTITEWKLEGVQKIRSITTKPLIAIGGITKNNAASVIRAGADCIAVVSAICSASDPRGAAEELRRELESGLKPELT